MKILFKYCLGFLFSTLVAAQPIRNPSSQIITEETIKSYGLTTIAEIVFLIDNLNTFTIDGATNFFSFNKLSPYQRQNVLVLIDGQKFDIGIFDVQNLNLLPISINQIDYVEIINVPGIINGNFVSSGAIHFHTKVPSRGLSVQGLYTIGDETGDPGPLAFTEFESPNVDKLAQYYSLNVNSAGEKWFMKGSLKHEENFKTDPAINKRISFLSQDDNKERLISYFYKMGANIYNGNQQFLAGITSNNDFFFFNPYANEIPVKQEFRHFSVNGNSVIKNFGLVYSAAQSINELGYLKNSEEINFDFGNKNLYINLEAFYKSDLFKTSFGFVYNHYNAVTSGQLTDNHISFRNFYGIVDLYPANNFSQSAGLYVTRSYHDIAYKGFLTTSWLFASNHLLFSNFSFIQNLFPEDNNFWVWQDRGYKLNSSNVIYNIPSEFNTKEIFTGDIVYKFSVDSLTSFSVGGNFRSFNNYYLEKQYFQYNSDNSTFSSITDINPDENIKTVGGLAELNLKLASNLSSKLVYNYSRYIDGSVLFKEKWASFPEHIIILNFNYQPFQNVGISTRLKYYSASTWYDYKYISYQSGEDYTYSMKVDPGLLIDLSANIWLWNKKIWLNTLLRNALNNPENYHPIGADLDMRFYLQVHFYFNSILE